MNDTGGFFVKVAVNFFWQMTGKKIRREKKLTASTSSASACRRGCGAPRSGDGYMMFLYPARFLLVLSRGNA